MIRKKVFMILCVATVLGGVIYFNLVETTLPIIKNIENCRIVKFECKQKFENEDEKMQEILIYDDDKILKCLSKYYIKKSYKRYNGGYLGDSQFLIYIDNGEYLQVIHIGSESFTYDGNRNLGHIIDAEGLKNELKIIMEGSN